MKKLCKNLLKSLLFVNFVLFSAAACKISIDDSNLSDAPNADAYTNLISVSRKALSSSTKYVNVYRRDVTACTSDDDKASCEVVDIGIIFKESYSKEDTDRMCTYIDYYITKDHYYEYMFRFCETDGYYYTKWSKEQQATTGYADSVALSYGVTDVKFKYNNSSYSLTIDGTVTAPGINNFAALFKPMLVVKTEELCQAFLIESVADGSEIQLRSLLTADFFGKDLQVVGIVAQKFEYIEISDEEILITKTDSELAELTKARLYWTEPSEIPLVLASDGTEIENNTINIPAGAKEDGYDYSRKAL